MRLVKNIEDYGDLVDRGLVKLKEDGEYIVAKYSKRVFWDSLWAESDMLEQARGHVFRKDTGDIVVRPFDKVFNYTECKAGEHLTPESIIFTAEKINGFLGVLTITPQMGALYSTTGSLTSDFVKMFRDEVETNHPNLPKRLRSVCNYPMTFLFEVCVPEDPHIIEEGNRLTLIGARQVWSGKSDDNALLKSVSEYIDVPVPKFSSMMFGQLLEKKKTEKIEGWMVLDHSHRTICKLKSSYYLSRKFLARVRKEKFENINKKDDRFDEEVAMCIEKIGDMSAFLDLPEQERLTYLRGIL